MLISLIKEGVGSKVLGQTSRLLRTSGYKPKQASYFLSKIILQLLRSVIRKGILYYLCPLIRRQIRKIVVISYPTCLLYPRIGISLGRSLKGVFKKLASFIAYQVSIRVNIFTLELAKVEVKTQYLSEQLYIALGHDKQSHQKQWQVAVSCRHEWQVAVTSGKLPSRVAAALAQ